MGPALALSFVLAGAGRAAGQIASADGFAARAHTLPRPAKGWVGLDRLPDGSLAAFDGRRLVALDPATGAVKKTLTTLPAPVFGTDVVTGPSGKVVFFGESSTGAIFAHDLGSGATRRVVTLGGNFTFAFHPDEGERFLYASAQPGFRGTAKVFRIDTRSGATDLIGEAAGFAGPIAFGAGGDLFFAPAPKDFRTPGLGRILRWSRAQVLSAIGPKSLRERDASVFAKGFDNALDFAIDGEGTFYVADAFARARSSLLEIGPGGGTAFASGIVRFAGESVTKVFFARGPRPFERFGREGSALWVLTSDFGTGNHLVELRPDRPRLSVAPSAKPRRGTPVDYRATRLPRRAAAVWMLGTALVPEKALLPLGAAGLRFPDFGVVLTAPLVVVVTPTDALGKAALRLRAPATGGFEWTTQVLAGPVRPLPGGTPASPWVTSSPVTVVTR